MAYASYVTREWNPAVQISEVESLAAGFVIGRIDVPASSVVTAAELQQTILESPAELTFLRYPSIHVRLAAEIFHPDLVVLQADTLMYFESQVSVYPAGKVRLQPARHDDSGAIRSTLIDVFEDYTNHYSANPLLQQVDVSQAYINWALRGLGDPDRQVLLATATGGVIVGIAVVDVRDDEFDEVLLAGIVQDSRSQGYYRSLVESIITMAASTGKERILISTQVSNIPAMRTWSGIGFRPALSLNTLHIMKKSPYSESSP